VNTLIKRIQPNPACILFVVLSKSKSPSPASEPHESDNESFAGIVGLLNTSPMNLSTEIGFIITFPPYQRSHVSSNAVGLLLHYLLDPPSSSSPPTPPGLGLRRVQWQTNVQNTPSISLAKKMGMKWEADLKWDRVLPVGGGKPGNGRRKREGGEGRDTATLAICWDDWEGGGRDVVRAVMER
jgi:RimJ/RimL family protein N-acetyltransferase